MYSLLYLMLAIGTCLANYRDGYDFRNLIEREVAQEDNERYIMDANILTESETVDCPVCTNVNSWLPSNEVCIENGNKVFKKCHYGTYINTVCGNKKDCYRGPGESCTEKNYYDNYGQKCARGYYCNDNKVCVGIEYTEDIKNQWVMDHFRRQPLRQQRSL